MHKWRTEILLFNYPTWFYGDDALYPYAVVKHLRESSRRRKDGRPLTLTEIADFVSTLTDPQMKRLAKEFPQVEDNKSKRPLFVFYKNYPGILSENGMTVSLNMLAMLKQLRIIKPLSNGEELERLRIIEDLTNSKETRRLYRVQFQARRPKTWIDAGRIYIFPGRSGT